MKHPYLKPLQLHPDSEDYKIHEKNKSPKILTKRLRELVPLLNFTKTTVVKVEGNYTELEMPLLEETMNQNGTHQASVFYLIADYTAGVGMFGALPGVYVTGINDRCHAYPVQYWLKSGKVVHLKPGLKTITAISRISSDDAFKMRQELISKGVTELEVNVDIYESGTRIAYTTHLMGLYGDIPRFEGRKINMFQNQNAMLSANMIAGLKSDSLSSRISTGLGKALANRFVYNTPELPEIIKSREISLNSFYQKYSEFQQVLILGLGLDTYPNRSSSQKNKQWFGIDLRGSIKQRKAMFEENNIDDSMIIKIAANLVSNDWFDKLIKTGFDTTKDTLVVMEGICMYLNTTALYRIFKKIKYGIKANNVFLWLDYVSEELYKTNIESARNFLNNISRLGEPFISSEREINIIREELLIKIEDIVAEKCSKYTNSDENIFEIYGFMKILIGNNSNSRKGQSTNNASQFRRKAREIEL